ncbi:MAG TPA: hypothetical protein VM658_09985 [bacterium]|nr:hypothetical protein [bacterium]
MLNDANVHGFGIRETLVRYFEDPAWPRLKARAFAVWAALLTRNITFVNFSAVSHRELVSMTGLARDTVSHGLKDLIKLGYVTRIAGDGRRNIAGCYQMLRVAEVAPVNGYDFKKEKMFGRAVNQVLDEQFKREAQKRSQSDLRSAGFSDETLAPVDVEQFLQSLESMKP